MKESKQRNVSRGGLLRKKVVWFFSCITLIAAILVAGRESYLPALGNFLIVKDDVKPADVVIVLGGEEERIHYAMRLYRLQLAKFIVITGGGGPVHQETSIAAWLKAKAVKAGIPEEKILLEPMAEHTFQHPVYVKPILEEHGFTSAIVVSSPYHMRRSRMLFNRVFRNSGIKLMYSPVAKSWFRPDNWWKHEDGARVVLSEYIKLAVDVWGAKVSERACTLLKEKKWSILVTR